MEWLQRRRTPDTTNDAPAAVGRQVRLAAVSVLIAISGVLSACGDDPAATRAEGPAPRQIDSAGSDFPYTGEQVFDLFCMHGLYLSVAIAGTASA